MSRERIHPAPFAVASDGSILANVNGYTGETDPNELLRRAMEDGTMIFVGTRLEAAEARELLRRLRDPCDEMTAYALGARNRRRRKRAMRDKGTSRTVSKKSS